MRMPCSPGKVVAMAKSRVPPSTLATMTRPLPISVRSPRAQQMSHRFERLIPHTLSATLEKNVSSGSKRCPCHQARTASKARANIPDSPSPEDCRAFEARLPMFSFRPRLGRAAANQHPRSCSAFLPVFVDASALPLAVAESYAAGQAASALPCCTCRRKFPAGRKGNSAAMAELHACTDLVRTTEWVQRCPTRVHPAGRQ